MYSVVLMMALTTGADSPAFGCRGCNSCGGCYAACNGCSSCKGGGLFSGLFNKGCRGCNNGCHGCSACHGYGYGGCHGYGCGGCHGAVVCSGGCHGAAACCGGGHAYCGGAPACCGHHPVKPKDMPKPKPDGEETAAPATIIVTLPADAKLTVDDNPTTSTSTTRVLVSPPLDPGKEFNYTLKGELLRDGKTVHASQRITVRAGQETRITLEFPTASVAQR
jgi:uncharacterized protein (TIGR03000 family)